MLIASFMNAVIVLIVMGCPSLAQFSLKGHSLVDALPAGLLCWTTDATDPVPQPPADTISVTAWQALSVGKDAICAVEKWGALHCWSSDGSSSTSSILKPPPNGNWSAVAVGTTHACGISIDGKLRCWQAQIFSYSFPFPTLPVMLPSAMHLSLPRHTFTPGVCSRCFPRGGNEKSQADVTREMSDLYWSSVAAGECVT